MKRTVLARSIKQCRVGLEKSGLPIRHGTAHMGLSRARYGSGQARPFLNLDSTPCLHGPLLRRAPTPAAAGTSSSPSSLPPSPTCSLSSLPSSSSSSVSNAPFVAPAPATPPSPSTPPSPPPSAASPSATASFDPSRSLSRGTSAAIFRGILPDGKSVAVKRLDHPSSSSPSSSPPQTSSNREFHNELHILANLPPSPFVVSLLGYCLNSPHRCLLVYEYMPNGSLQDALFSSFDHHLVLSWDRRFGIVLDVAQALAFLSWDRRLGSGLGARLAHQATQTGMMRGRTR